MSGSAPAIVFSHSISWGSVRAWAAASEEPRNASADRLSRARVRRKLSCAIPNALACSAALPRAVQSAAPALCTLSATTAGTALVASAFRRAALPSGGAYMARAAVNSSDILIVGLQPGALAESGQLVGSACKQREQHERRGAQRDTRHRPAVPAPIPFGIARRSVAGATRRVRLRSQSGAGRPRPPATSSRQEKQTRRCGRSIAGPRSAIS